MTTNFIQPGKVIDYTAGSAVTAGAVVAIGQILGVALENIAAGATGSVQVEGVFEVPKVTTAVIAQGDPVLWDASAGKFDAKGATPATGDILGSAVAFKAGANGETTAWIKFTSVHGTKT